MKKSYTLIAALCFLFANESKAQDLVELSLHRLELGFRFMPTVSNFQLEAYAGGTIAGQATFGYGVGGLLGFNFTEHSSIQGEVIYNSLSQKYKSGDIDRTLHVQYLNIPLFYSLSTGKSNPVNLSLQIGPQIGISLGSDISTSGGGSGADTLTAIVDVKKGDFGFAYGTCLSFSLNKMRTIRLDLGYRGVYGFMNVSDTRNTPGANSFYDLEFAAVRTNSIFAGLTLCF